MGPLMGYGWMELMWLIGLLRGRMKCLWLMTMGLLTMSWVRPEALMGLMMQVMLR